MDGIANSPKIMYFLMRERTENQIIERLGGVAVDAAKNLKTLGFVRTRTEGDETFYELNGIAKFSNLTSPAYWHYVLRERFKTL